MKLRFRINQAELFRRGIDAPKSIVTIDVDPNVLPAFDRNMIADHLEGGIAVMAFNGEGMIVALDPTIEGLLAALRLDQKGSENEA